MSIDIQKLTTNNDEKYIVRNKVKKTCTIVFLLRVLSHKNRFLDHKYQVVHDKNECIEIFQFNQELFNSSYMIQTFNYSSDNQVFKLHQHYYESTLYSIKPHNLTFLQKIQTITQIARIVKYYNDQSICIRTLRPQILSFSKDKSEIDVKLIWMDSGVRLQNCKSQTNQPIHSRNNLQYIPYLAPQIRMKKSYGVKADVWSLGVIFYQLLFGNTYGIIFANQVFKVTYPTNTPKWLQNILNLFLHSDPKKRCSINNCFSYLKPLKCCSQTASKIMPKILQI